MSTSQRHLGFYVPRANFLKVMGPVIDHLVRQRAADYRVVILVPRWLGADAGKPQPPLAVEPFSRVWGERVDIVELPTASALIDRVRGGTLAALFSVLPMLPNLDDSQIVQLRAESVRRGVKWIALPDGFAQNAMLAAEAARIAAQWDLVCTVGSRSMRFIETSLQRVASSIARTVRHRVAVVGYPELDMLHRPVNAVAIRQKYGLPPERPIVFVATAPRIVPLTTDTWMARGLDARFRTSPDRSARAILAHACSLSHPKLVSYQDYLTALRRFADANGAMLVGKTRPKHGDPAWLHDYLDYLFSDESFFPFTTIDLLRASSLYFGFYSNTASEAIASGLYAFTALFLPPDVVEPSGEWRELSAFMKWGGEGLWQVPGVSEIIRGSTGTGAAALRQFAESDLKQYRPDEERRQQVLKEFFNFPCDSSSLVMESYESVCH